METIHEQGGGRKKLAQDRPRGKYSRRRPKSTGLLAKPSSWRHMDVYPNVPTALLFGGKTARLTLYCLSRLLTSLYAVRNCQPRGDS